MVPPRCGDARGADRTSPQLVFSGSLVFSEERGFPMAAISERKRAANRANAKRSTGPKSPAGKAAAARNALVHGLSSTSRHTLLPSDDPRAYRRFARRILDELAPDGALQEELAAEVVNLSWKLRRVPGAESILMAENHAQEDAPPPRVICKMILSRDSWDHRPNSPLWILDRYAARIERARASALRMLLTLQKRQASRAEEDGFEDGFETDDDDDVDRVNEDGPARDDAGDEAVAVVAAGDSDVATAAGDEAAEAGDTDDTIHDAPLPNEATAGPGTSDAQVISFTTDATIDAPSTADPAAPSEATAADADAGPHESALGDRARPALGAPAGRGAEVVPAPGTQAGAIPAALAAESCEPQQRQQRGQREREGEVPLHEQARGKPVVPEARERDVGVAAEGDRVQERGGVAGGRVAGRGVDAGERVDVGPRVADAPVGGADG